MKQASLPSLVNVSLGWVALLICMGLYLPPRVQSGYTPKEPQADWEKLSRDDPKLGAVLVHPIQVKSPTGKPVAYFVIGDCTSCALSKLDNINIEQIRKRVIPVVLALSLDDLRLLKKTNLSQRGFTLASTSPDMILKWNPYFMPRLYVIEPSGRLIGLQQPEMTLVDGLARWRGTE